MKKLILVLMLLGTIGYTANRITNADIDAAAGIVFSKFQNADALSVLGRSANSSGVLDEIVAGADGDVLRRSGTTVGFGEITLGALPQSASGEILGNSTGSTADVASTTLTAIIDRAICSTQGSLLYRAASSWLCLAPGTSGQVLQTNGAGANPSWATGGGGSGAVYSALFNCSRPVADSNTLFLANFDQNPTYDFSPTKIGTATIGANASISSTEEKFGPSSGYFPGTGGNSSDSIKWTSAGSLVLGTGNFTIDFWWRPTSNTQVGLFSFNDGSATAQRPYLYITNTGAWRFQNTTANNIFNATLPSGSISTGVWHHIAVMRSGTTTYLFVDGVLELSGTDTTNYVAPAGNELYIGYGPQDNFPARGYIDEFRVSNTARFSTSGFTPPTSAYDVAPVITKGSDFISSISSDIATAGTCQPQFIGGIFSTAPACTVSALNATAASYANHYQAATTSQAFVKSIVSGSAADGQVYMICE